MRYIVIGAGGIGSTVGGLLARSGREVVLVARGAHLDALRASGLTVATPAGTFTIRPPAVSGPGEFDLSDGDVLLLAVKSQDTAGVLADWSCRHPAARSPPICCPCAACRTAWRTSGPPPAGSLTSAVSACRCRPS